MYRGRHWTMRQYAGFATAAESNERYRYLLASGVTGLSVAFDLPTQLGHDSDAPQSRGEVGKVGVAIDTIEDVETLFDADPARSGHRVDDDQRAGVDPARVRARGRAAARHPVRQARRHDSERRAQRVRRARHVHLPAGAVDAAGDRRDGVLRASRCRTGTRSRSPATTSAKRVRRRCKRSRSRSPTRRRTCARRSSAGLDVDTVAPRISFFWNAHNDFFEEIAKFRAARTLWARDRARRVRLARSEVADAALPHADGRLDADRAGAAEQRRARRAAGAGRGARRHAVAAHERPGRSAGPADGAVRARRAAHAADHRATRAA